jgi:signal transduction histidine kinase/DNA-binding response OmpR family regulator
VSKLILTLEVRLQRDVVLARQRARQVAGLLGFDSQDQVRVATAVSEIARNAFQYAGGGRVEFLVEEEPPLTLMVRVRDRGPGIKDVEAVLQGRADSGGGGLGLVSVRRLMDRFRIESVVGGGTTVVLGKVVPRRSSGLPMPNLGRVAEELARRSPDNPLEEVQRQNQELLRTLEELHQRQEELSQLNRELEDTNRGVVALYAELDEKADFLRRASEMKSRFLSNMGHEFRTPLNAVTGLARLLLDRTDGELTAEQEKQVKLIHKAADDLMELVNDLLDLARVEAGKVVVRSNEFEVSALFGALRGLLRPLLVGNSSVSLVFEEPVGAPMLHTDEGKVSQILRNFISNALKFTERGEIRVSARPEQDGTVIFSVADTGVGIAPEDQDRIFEEFVQVDDPRHKGLKGSGLGLPLVRKLAGLLGGRILLQSQPGVGSTFSVVLPCTYSGPAEVVFVPDVTTHVDVARRPVLVVEDNRETLFIYEKYLKGSPFQVIPARTLKEARVALGQFRPAVVILDVLLDSENTWELLAELKEAESTRDIPVYVVTLVENEGKALSLGADGFCIKPVDRAWLLSRLQRTSTPTTPEKVLLIDDDETARYLLKEMLGGTRFATVEAGTGAEGLQCARREQPRAVFLDLELPDRTGVEVLQELKTEPGTRNIPVIIHTSRVLDEEERQRLLALGAAAVLSKESTSREQGMARLGEVLRQAGLLTEK